MTQIELYQIQHGGGYCIGDGVERPPGNYKTLCNHYVALPINIGTLDLENEDLCADCVNRIIASMIHDKVYKISVHSSILLAIIEWLGDPDTQRSKDETIESLSTDWIETAHRES